MEEGLCYEPKVESINNIEYDFLENAWIDNLGNIYKTTLPEEIRQYATPIKEPKLCVKVKAKKKRHFVK